MCTAYTSNQYRDAVKEGYAFVAGLAELRNVTYVDLPTSHWPMWSRPKELAAIIGNAARTASGPNVCAVRAGGHDVAMTGLSMRPAVKPFFDHPAPLAFAHRGLPRRTGEHDAGIRRGG